MIKPNFWPLCCLFKIHLLTNLSQRARWHISIFGDRKLELEIFVFLRLRRGMKINYFRQNVKYGEWETVGKANCEMKMQDSTKNWKIITELSDFCENGELSKKALMRNLFQWILALFHFNDSFVAMIWNFFDVAKIKFSMFVTQDQEYVSWNYLSKKLFLLIEGYLEITYGGFWKWEAVLSELRFSMPTPTRDYLPDPSQSRRILKISWFTHSKIFLFVFCFVFQVSR